MGKEQISKANKLTLNKIQEILSVKSSKTEFLRMFFPESLRYGDENNLLDFIYNLDPSNQNSRSIFMTGNIIKNKKASTYSRAHQEALSLIAHQMNTSSCLSDMLKLISISFPFLTKDNIISMCKLDSDVYPVNFQNILNAEVYNDDFYKILSYLILWSIFGERIHIINFQIKSSNIPITSKDQIYQYADTIEYFQSNMNELDNIESVEFSFISGIRWLMDNERIDIIQELLCHNIKLKIIIAEASSAETISKNMRNPDRTYIKFPQVRDMWYDFYCKHKDLVKIKVSSIPLLRNYASFNKKKGDSNLFFVLYTYANYNFKNNFSHRLDESSPYYITLKNEFNYLWDSSDDIDSE